VIGFNCRVACFSTSQVPEVQSPSGQYEPDGYAIPGRGWCKSRMWSQYGEDHRGLCLVFSRKAFEEQLEALTASVLVAERVQYLREEGFLHRDVIFDGDPLGRDEMETHCLKHVQRNSRDLFLTKELDYRDEAEYRVVIYASHGTNTFVDISKTLRGVIAGVQTPKVYFPVIRSLAGGYDVECMQASWDYGTPHLKTLKVKGGHVTKCP